MRTRRRAKYTWFPNIGFQGADEENDLAGFPFQLIVDNAVGVVSTDIFELIPDFVHSQPGTIGDSLNEFIGNEYILKRVVGKLFANVAASQPNGMQRILFGAGLFVARADEAAPQLPIGAASAAERNLNYGVLNNQNIREPWLWRRTWMLQNPGIPVIKGILGTFNGQSVADGPHVDAKSARRVRQDERLFMSISAVGLDDLNVGEETTLEGFFDYRVLGALRKAKSRSAF